MAYIAVKGGRGDILYCAIVWAMRGGDAGAQTKGLFANNSSGSCTKACKGQAPSAQARPRVVRLFPNPRLADQRASPYLAPSRDTRLIRRLLSAAPMMNTPNLTDPARAMRTAQWLRWLGSRIHSCATPFQSRRAPVRVVLSGRWPVPLVGSSLESRSAALGGFLATTTSTIKRRCAVSHSVFV